MKRWQLMRRTGLFAPIASATRHVDNPCRIVITGVAHSRPQQLKVRCECQAQVHVVAHGRYYGFDPLGTADSLAGALEIWRRHVAEAQASQDHGADGGIHVAS